MFTNKQSAEAIAKLRETLKPGDRLYTTLRSVSRSGMSRVIDVHAIQNNQPIWLGYLVAKALQMPYDDRKQGIKVSGCGMDMGFHIVSNLSAVMFRETGVPCTGDNNCASNDHNNPGPQRDDYTPGHMHQGRDYAFHHSWM